MHYVRTLSGSTLTEQMNPSFRKVTFSDERAAVTVSTLLREAWTVMPPEQQHTSQSLGTWMAAYSHKTREEQAATPRNKDCGSVHTAWRDVVYEMFNHVFHDVYQWMREACMLEGEFKPPAHEAFGLPFPKMASGSSAVTARMERVWDRAVFLIPAYVAKGCVVRAYRLEDRYGSYGEKGEELDKFDLQGDGEGEDGGRYDVWYVLPGTRVRFVIDVVSEGIEETQDVAAVVVVGRFTKIEESSEGEVQQGEHWMGLAADEHRVEEVE